MRRQPQVLLLCTDEIEAFSLEEALREHALLTRAWGLLDLKEYLETASFDAIFSAWSFHMGTWKSALNEVQRLQPDLPVIVFSQAGGEREWTQVLESGGFDLLVPPYRESIVVPALEQATASYDARLMRRLAAS